MIYINKKIYEINDIKLIQFQNGLKGLKKRNLNTKGKNDKEKVKKVKHLTHINLKGIIFMVKL